MHQDAANAQHYEVPADFYRFMLGKHLKYSCCYYPNGDETLDQAEAAMLALTRERAGVTDAMDILELGCGWGSLSLYLAQTYPEAPLPASVTAIPSAPISWPRQRRVG